MIVIYAVVIPLIVLGAVGAGFTIKGRNRSLWWLLLWLAGPMGWWYIWLYLKPMPKKERSSKLEAYLAKVNKNRGPDEQIVIETGPVKIVNPTTGKVEYKSYTVGGSKTLEEQLNK